MLAAQMWSGNQLVETMKRGAELSFIRDWYQFGSKLIFSHVRVGTVC